MSRREDLVKNTAILSLGKICTQFINFFLLPLYTALLTPGEYGIIDLFNTYAILLVPIFNLQLDVGLFRYMIDYRNDDRKKSNLLSTVINSNIIQSIVYLAFYFILSHFISSPYKFYLAIDVILNIFLSTFLQFSRGIGNNKNYALGSFVSASSTVILNVIFITLLKMGALGMFYGSLLGKAIAIILLVVLNKIWKYYKLAEGSAATFKSICKYSIPLIPNQLSWWIIDSSDRTIITAVMNTAATGIYGVANKFSSIYITVFNIFNLSWTESVSVHINDKDKDLFIKDTINTMYRFFSTICLLITSCLPFVFNLMVDDKYKTAFFQVPILMVAVLFQSLVGLYSTVYVARKKSVEIAKTSGLAAIINIVVNILLIKHMGLYAATISTLVAYLTMAVYRYVDIKKYVKAPLEKKNIVISFSLMSFVVVAYYINNVYMRVCALCFVIIYAVLMNRHEIKYVFRLIRKRVRNY